MATAESLRDRRSRSTFIVAGALCLAGALSPAGAAPAIGLDEWVMKAGDDPSWSRPDFDDSDWQRTAFDDVPGVDSILWLRTDIELRPEHLSGRKPLGIYFAAMASHEIWWDGELIGRGGTVGAGPEQEQPGPIEAYYAIPDRLSAPGTHSVAVRCSAFHRHFEPGIGYWFVVVAEYDRLARAQVGYTSTALIGLSGILMVGIFALMMFLQDRRDASFLFLGLLCLTGALLLIAESWRSLFGYTYNWHILRLVVVTGLSWLLDVLLIVFLARRFPMPGARPMMLAGIIAATLPLFLVSSWDGKGAIGFFGVFLIAAGWAAGAVRRRLSGGIPALIGLSVCVVGLAVAPFRFQDRNLYLSLNILLICLLASHVRQVQQDRREREGALLKSARLEIELLRKHIQPHFLMNTLTALSEWIEESPETAVTMIQALSEEFRMLADISGRRLIRMEEEIRLCRVHLDIMSRRKGREYALATEGIDPKAPMPPAIIHTLVENAITHDRNSERRVEFRLTQEESAGRRRYLFEAPLGRPAAGEARKEGTGLRYIRARLQESFGNDWAFESGPEGATWRTEIVMPAGA